MDGERPSGGYARRWDVRRDGEERWEVEGDTGRDGQWEFTDLGVGRGGGREGAVRCTGEGPEEGCCCCCYC